MEVEMSKSYFNTPQGQIHYRTEGSGEPLLLLHQVPMSLADFDNIIPLLARSYQVVAMDSMGHGNSDDLPFEFGIEDYARSVISLLDGLGINKTHIAAHHTGAMIAVEVAATYPKRVDKLVISGCPSEAPPLPPPSQRPGQTRDITMDKEGQFLIKAWETYNRLSVPDLEPQLVFKPFLIALTSRLRPDTHSPTSRNREYLENIRERMKLVKSPTLAISGSRDSFLKDIDIIKDIIPKSRTLVVEGFGFFPNVENPQGFAEAVLDFLKNPGV